MRARDHGIVIGSLEPGASNAITDVPGVRVGHTTLISGESVRTGVTVIVPHDGEPFAEPVFAGYHWLNGNGELTGMAYLRELGMLASPIGLTSTGSVGVVRDALAALDPGGQGWSLPVVGETWDGSLNDITGRHVTAEHVAQAFSAASGGAVAEGSVGGGTGMICHGFKGGVGTASRVVDGLTVGVLVQANHGHRDRLTVNGVNVGRSLGVSGVPHEGAGSIIGTVATDAPLLPHQCTRLARRAALGVGRTGGAGENSSGDGFLCFATGNRNLPRNVLDAVTPKTYPVTVMADDHLDPLYHAVIEATEEAIVNALVAADTMTGFRGLTVEGLDGARLAYLLAGV
ncbi:DmpA family aminopeptidase [Herbidospora mongoliensis]|uniref:DmpA family aminopeptidase n=1 Tax=Herbidospora mongoliensis TaxID=688067 RepID=UPI00082E58B0|nr:P1 family peptidase [Herbidospora mongoliensis]